MPAKITYNYVPEEYFLDFVEDNNLEIIINKRKDSNLPKFSASIKNGEVSEPSVLISRHGHGNTPLEAVRDLAKELSNKLLIINAFSNREEIYCPRFIGPTKLP